MQCCAKIEFQNVHILLEPIFDISEMTKVEEIVKEGVEKVEEVVDKIDKVEELKIEEVIVKTDKVVTQDDEILTSQKIHQYLMTKVKPVVDKVEEVIQKEETPEVEGKHDCKYSASRCMFVFN